MGLCHCERAAAYKDSISSQTKEELSSQDGGAITLLVLPLTDCILIMRVFPGAWWSDAMASTALNLLA